MRSSRTASLHCSICTARLTTRLTTLPVTLSTAHSTAQPIIPPIALPSSTTSLHFPLHRFSKFVHGTAFLNRSEICELPYWSAVLTFTNTAPHTPRHSPSSRPTPPYLFPPSLAPPHPAPPHSTARHLTLFHPSTSISTLAYPIRAHDFDPPHSVARVWQVVTGDDSAVGRHDSV